MITAILVEDHEIYRLGLKTAFQNNYPDIEIVAEAETGSEFFSLLKVTSPDIVLLDIKLPDMSGVEIARRLKQEKPEMKILVISTEDAEETIRELVEIGIDGFISKREGGVKAIVEAIHSIMRGLEFFGKDIANILYRVYVAKKRAAEETVVFSEKEKEIVELCSKGLQSKEIADRLNLSSRTIECHKTRIFRKLGINNTVEMVQYALKNGIIRVFFLLLCFLLLGCGSKKTEEIKQQTAGESITKPEFESEVDSLEWVLEVGNTEAQLSALSELQTYYQKVDLPKSFSYSWQQEKIAIKEKMAFWLADAYTGLGINYYYDNNIDSAVFYLHKAINIHEKEHNWEKLAKNQVNIATMFRYQEKHDSAFFYLYKGLEYYEKENDEETVSRIYCNIASTYADVKNYDKDYEYLSKALAIQERIGSKTPMGVTLANIGSYFEEQQKYHEAIEYYVKGLEIFRDAELPWYVCGTLTKIHSSMTQIDDAR